MQVNITIKNIQGSGESKLLYAILMKDFITERKGCYLSKDEMEAAVADICEEVVHDQVIGLPAQYLRDVEKLFRKLSLSATFKIWIFDSEGNMIVRGYEKAINYK